MKFCLRVYLHILDYDFAKFHTNWSDSSAKIKFHTVLFDSTIYKVMFSVYYKLTCIAIFKNVFEILIWQSFLTVKHLFFFSFFFNWQHLHTKIEINRTKYCIPIFRFLLANEPRNLLGMHYFGKLINLIGLGYVRLCL